MPGLQRHRAGHGGRLVQGRGSGSATADVIVRDPVVVAGTLPRFLNLGDQSRFFVQIDNVEGRRATTRSTSTSAGPLAIPASRRARSDASWRPTARPASTIPVTADGRRPGGRRPAADRARASTPRRASPSGSARRAATLYRRIVRGRCRRERACTVSNDLVADFVPGTGRGLAGGLARRARSTCRPCCRRSTAIRTAAPSRSSAGRCRCSTSTSSPGAEARRSTTRSTTASATPSTACCRRQDANGAFGLWSVGGTERRSGSTPIVTDFLTRARERGFAVPQKAFDNALDRLRNTVANATEVERGQGPGRSPMRSMCWPATAGP